VHLQCRENEKIDNKSMAVFDFVYAWERLFFPKNCPRPYTVTRATQNEALLWKVAVLGMKKPPVGAGTFCPSPILVP
jgi:hypothetical protein